MKLIKNMLGFNSPYSWVKWLRCSFAAAALIIALGFLNLMGGTSITNEAGFFGIIIFFILFLIIAAPAVLILLGVSMLIGLIFGGSGSVKKQQQSLKESAEAGSEVVETDKLRIKTQTYNFLLKALWVAVAIIGIIIYFSAGGAGLMIYGAIAITIMVIITYCISKANNKFSSSFKRNIVKAELESVLGNVDYKPNDRFNDYTIKACGLFPAYSSYSGDDYFSADYKGRRYTQSDIHLQERDDYETTDSDGHSHTKTRYITLFRGRMIMFDSGVVSSTPVCVYDKRMRNIKSDIQSDFNTFNQKYVIAADNETETFRILTPPMIDKIMLVGEKINAPMSVSFLQDKIFVAVSSGNAFEANIEGDITLTQQRERIKGEVAALVNTMESVSVLQRSKV